MRTEEAILKELPASAFLTRQEVLSMVRISAMTLWRLEQKDRFPKSIKLSQRRVGYRVSDINSWLGGKRDWAPKNTDTKTLGGQK